MFARVHTPPNIFWTEWQMNGQIIAKWMTEWVADIFIACFVEAILSN